MNENLDAYLSKELIWKAQNMFFYIYKVNTIPYLLYVFLPP